MKYLLALLLLISGGANAASPFFNTKVSTSGSGGGGGVTGSGAASRNAYWSSAANLTFDNNITDDGAGSLSLIGTTSILTVSTTNASGIVYTKPTNANVPMQFTSNATSVFMGLTNNTPTSSWAVADTAALNSRRFLQVAVNTGNVGIGLLAAVPNTNLDVSGTISSTQALFTSNVSLTTGYVHMGSPTTIPTCNAANAGNTFMNITTHCLNYCDGTANRQVTSVAATCT